MTRTVAGDVSTEITEISVRPFHIAKLEFATNFAYISEGPEVLYSGDTYLEGSLVVDRIQWSESGVQNCKLRMLDYNGSAIVLALNNKIADTPVSIWLTYGTSASFVTPTLLVKGTLSPGEINEDFVGLDVVPINAESEFFPQDYCTKESGFDYLPRRGEVVDWGGEKYELVTK